MNLSQGSAAFSGREGGGERNKDFYSTQSDNEAFMSQSIKEGEMGLTACKRTAMATALVIAGVVSGGQAQAIEFGNGDLVLALYGNNTELLMNLKQQSSLLGSTPTTITINASDLTAVSGSNRINWSLYGFNQDVNLNPTTFVGGTVKALSAFTPTEIINASPVNGWNAAAIQGALLAGDGLLVQRIPASDFNSFTKVFGPSSLASAFAVSTAGSLGGMLNIISGNVTTGALSQIGQAMLSLDGSTLTIGANLAAVPVPAAVVLFGTGLIGLVGIARRSMRQAA